MINIVSLDNKKAIEFLLFAEYQREWEVIDRMNQHPRGINFYQWLFEKKLIKEWEFKKIQEQIKAEYSEY